MQRRNIIAITAFMIVALLGIGIVSANRFGGNFMELGFMNHGDLTDEEIEEMQTQTDAINKAITDNDYDAWKTLMEEKIAQLEAQLTEENFNILVEKYNEREAQKLDTEELQSEIEKLKEEFCASHNCPELNAESNEDFQEKHQGMRKGFQKEMPTRQDSNQDSE